MVFRREGTYGLVALIVAIFAFGLLSEPAWSQTTTINETGSGTASTSQSNCQNTGNRECTTTVQGSVIGNPITNPSTSQGIVGTFTADYDDAVVTGSTFTVPAEGEITLTDADGSRLFLSAEGDLSGPVTPAGATLTFDGTFEVTGGTGEFNGATGEGDITATLTGSPSGTFTASLSGTLSQQSGDEDLTITKEADANSVDVGEELDYEVTVTNEGDSEVSDLVIRDLLPDDVDPVDVVEGEGIDDCPTTDDDEVRCRLDPLGANDEAVLFITIEPQEDADSEIENVAQLRLNGTTIDEDSVETDVNDGGGGGNNNGPPNRPPFFPPNFVDEDDDGIPDAIDDDIDEDDGDIDSSVNSTDDDCIETDTDTDTDTNTTNETNSDTLEDSSIQEEDFSEIASLERIDFETVAFQSNNDPDDDPEDETDEFSEEDSFETEELEDDLDNDTLEECEDEDGVSATSDEDGATAETPGATARAGGDPDDQEPVTEVPDDVVDEVPTSGPLPNTGGFSPIVLALSTALSVGGLLAFWAVVTRRARA